MKVQDCFGNDRDAVFGVEKLAVGRHSDQIVRLYQGLRGHPRFVSDDGLDLGDLRHCPRWYHVQEPA